MKPEDKKCCEWQELIFQYLDDELTAAEKNEFEAHLAECEGCSAVLEKARKTEEALHCYSRSVITPDITQGLREKIKTQERLKRIRRYSTIAASVVVVAALVMVSPILKALNGTKASDRMANDAEVVYQEDRGEIEAPAEAEAYNYSSDGINEVTSEETLILGTGAADFPQENDENGMPDTKCYVVPRSLTAIPALEDEELPECENEASAEDFLEANDSYSDIITDADNFAELVLKYCHEIEQTVCGIAICSKAPDGFECYKQSENYSVYISDYSDDALEALTLSVGDSESIYFDGTDSGLLAAVVNAD